MQNVRIVRSWRTPPLILVDYIAAAVVTLAVGVPTEDVVGKQNGACCNPDGGVPEQIVD